MPEAKPPLLVFLVDAFRHDFLTRGRHAEPVPAGGGGRPPPAQADPRIQRRHPGHLLHRTVPGRDGLLDGVLLPAGDQPLAGPVAPRAARPAAERPGAARPEAGRIRHGDAADLARRKGVPHLSMRHIPFRASTSSTSPCTSR